jgi:Ca2+/Na+ antiporter
MSSIPGRVIYREQVSSFKTEALFLALTALFALLFLWRVNVTRLDALALLFVFFAVFFLFYSINYRRLEIMLTSEFLKLTFGVFRWHVPLDNIAGSRLDDLPLLVRLGGAWIHFMMIRKRYRLSFNYYPYIPPSTRRKYKDRFR